MAMLQNRTLLVNLVMVEGIALIILCSPPPPLLSLIACCFLTVLMNVNCNCLVLQSGERRKATFSRDTASGTETVEGLSLHEMELATHTEDLFLVFDVGARRMRGARNRCNRHDAKEVSARRTRDGSFLIFLFSKFLNSDCYDSLLSDYSVISSSISSNVYSAFHSYKNLLLYS